LDAEHGRSLVASEMRMLEHEKAARALDVPESKRATATRR
jgi:hypothetical protein